MAILTTMTINLDVYITGKNSRALQITGDITDSVKNIQVLRSFKPQDTQSEDDGKLYGSDDVPIYRVYFDDAYSQDNRLGSDDDDWEILGFLDEGSCIYVDTERLPWNKSRDVYYKMRVFTENGHEDTPVVAAGRFHDKTYTPAINGLKSALEIEIKENGRNGYLLKARHWGRRCSRCADYGTGRPINDHCPECFGTGYKDGYYEAMSLPIIDSAPQRQQGRSAEDYIESEALSARCLANPVILRGDIWVSTNTNDRYLIDQVSTTSLYKGIPVVYTMVLKKLPQSDVIFEKDVENIIENSFVNWETVGK